jgi:predicted RNA-binding protein (TIGR00451 family)
LSSQDERRRLSIMLDYLFGRGVGSQLPREGLEVVYSRRSGRIKLVLHNKRVFATVKPSGAIALSVYGASLLTRSRTFRKSCVVVTDEAAAFVKQGKSAFCKFVIEAGSNVYPKGEVAVLDRVGRVVGVGSATMRGEFMREFKSGVAVKVREGSG